MKEFTLKQIQEISERSLNAPPTGDNFIDDRYSQHVEKFGHPMSYYRLLYNLAKELEPELTVELGAWQATGAAHFAAGYAGGRVITIDHHGDPGDDLNKLKAEEAQAHYPNLVYLQGWTWDMVEIVQSFNDGIDILFIDSWHQYEYVRKDWDLYTPLMNKPSLIICDDILGGDGPVIAGMKRFWDELPGEKFLDGAIHAGFPMGFLKWE